MIKELTKSCGPRPDRNVGVCVCIVLLLSLPFISTIFRWPTLCFFVVVIVWTLEIYYIEYVCEFSIHNHVTEKLI